MGLLSLFRISCYVFLGLFSLVTIGLGAARLHYTLHLPPHDPLNGGVKFYDHIVPEIIATASISTLFAIFLVSRIKKRHEHHDHYKHGYFSTFGGELTVLLLLFILWVVGAALATKQWGDLGWCHNYSTCRILTALVAFTWMSWIMTFFLTFACILYIARNGGFAHHVNGRDEYGRNMREV